MILYLFCPPGSYFYPQLCACWTSDQISYGSSARLEKLERCKNIPRWTISVLTSKFQILYSFLQQRRGNAWSTWFWTRKIPDFNIFLHMKMQHGSPNFSSWTFRKALQNFSSKHNRKEMSAMLSGPNGRYFLGLVNQKMTAFKHLCADEKKNENQLVHFRLTTTKLGRKWNILRSILW